MLLFSFIFYSFFSLCLFVGRYGEWELSKGMGKVITLRQMILIERDEAETSKRDTKMTTRTVWMDTTINEIVVGLVKQRGKVAVLLFHFFFLVSPTYPYFDSCSSYLFSSSFFYFFHI